MSAITADRTVGELVTESPGRSRVFEEHGIDYCCGGKKPLAEACATKGVSAADLIQQLTDADAAASEEDGTDYSAMALDDLVVHIVSTHHAYLGRELPRLEQMAEKVAKVHGEKDSRLGELAEVVNALVAELTAHMMKEERILFPVIQQLAQSDTMPAIPFGTVANPIRAMEAEHDSAGGALERLRELTDGFTPPDWACNTYRALFDGLRELESDLHQHIHKENNILFPKAIVLEESRRA